ncbi:glycosyltransferase family 4 protein [Bacillus sp. REN3]|uniref:glycosyltransferase n=1 Tax=Bacillus sp. REN3 TaxID=2802440 RepID=UPI001AEDBFE3
METKTVKVNWRGSQLEEHSLAIVNRNICRHLQKQNIILRKEIPEKEKLLESYLKDRTGSFKPFAEPDVTISHQWPPDFSRPKTGLSICMQPWEFGAIPRDWYIPMKYWMDEIWVYSSWNKESYVRSGIPESKVHVIPLGVDGHVFHQDAEPRAFEAPSSFKFLFVGGTIGRKGIDILLRAYLNEFTAEEDVCLIIKDTGTKSFYKGITLEKMILEAMSEPTNPRIKYIDAQLSGEELAGLYKGCDCLVHPYRGEGFGLPIAEAMACGLPAIVPDKGSSQDFCSEETAFFIPSTEVAIAEKRIGNLETIDHPWWLSIKPEDLQKTMRTVFGNRTLAREKGKKASEHIRASFTWEKSSERISGRIEHLVSRRKGPVLSDKAIIETELKRANELHSGNRSEEALGVFQNILAVYPDTIMARYNSAIIYMEKKLYQKAIGQLASIAQNMGKQDKEFQDEIWRMVGICFSKMKSIVE